LFFSKALYYFVTSTKEQTLWI